MFQICSNINSCKCHDGFMGNDCSQIAPTFAPPMYPRTPYPGAQNQPTTMEPENTSPNVHIRKSVNHSLDLLWLILIEIAPVTANSEGE